jgi:hypothetical protein
VFVWLAWHEWLAQRDPATTASMISTPPARDDWAQHIANALSTLGTAAQQS